MDTFSLYYIITIQQIKKLINTKIWKMPIMIFIQESVNILIICIIIDKFIMKQLILKVKSVIIINKRYLRGDSFELRR